MKIYIFFIALLATVVGSGLPALSQTKYYIYTYDDSGNRTRRERDMSKSATINPGDNTAKSEAEKEAEKKDIASDQEITIYPNPTNGLLNVNIPDLGEGTAVLGVYNVNGKLVYKKTLNNTLSQVDIKNQPSGIYLFKITIGGNSKDWKIIKD
jgi:hypothetical protein